MLLGCVTFQIRNSGTRSITENRKIVKQLSDHNHAPFGGWYVDFRLNRSSDMIGAPKIVLGNLTTPLSGTVRRVWLAPSTCTSN